MAENLDDAFAAFLSEVAEVEGAEANWVWDYRIHTHTVIEARINTNEVHTGEHKMETGVISYAE